MKNLRNEEEGWFNFYVKFKDKNGLKIERMKIRIIKKVGN